MVEANRNVLPTAEIDLDNGGQGLGKRKRKVEGRVEGMFKTCMQSQSQEKTVQQLLLYVTPLRMIGR